ncbi:hypothetical protein MANI_014243 [Metarhizium anisopliae]|nr:hypothetical protein MANI_014243 [Metarhizium anisopliae]
MVDFGIADSGRKGGNDANSPMKSSFDSSIQNEYPDIRTSSGLANKRANPVLVATRPANDLHYSSLEECLCLTGYHHQDSCVLVLTNSGHRHARPFAPRIL